MDTWGTAAAQLLWRTAIAAIPLTLLVAAVCRWAPCRPATRHSLWAILLAWFLVSPLLPGVAVVDRLAARIGSIAGSGGSKPVEGAPGTSEGSGDPMRDAPTEASRGAPVDGARGAPADAADDVYAALPNDGGVVDAGGASADRPETRPADEMDPTPPWYVARTAPRVPDALSDAAGTVGPHSFGPLDAVEALTPTSLVSPTRRMHSWWTLVPAAAKKAVVSIAEFVMDWNERLRPRKRPRRPSTAIGLAEGPREDSRVAAAELLPSSDASPAVVMQRQAHPLASRDHSFHSRDDAFQSRDREGAGSRDSESPLPYGRGSEMQERGSEKEGRGSETDSETASQWFAGLVAVRDALTRLPSLPPIVWLAGVVLLCVGHAVRALLFRRRVVRAVAAPREVVRLVARTARRFRLRRAPQALMIGGDVSPMIWCGRRPRLVLPLRLWSQLDDVGREAIVCHELAHLRRCDHWVCWGEALAGVLYWWHPLVWWARRRLHEEAELCCDAWVTWLMPHGRRAYAEALLRTSEFVGRAQRVGPAVGMAVTSGRTRQFARRLTMVMTESTRPRLSMSGIALAALIAAASWAAVPARSCPPQSANAPEAPTAETPSVPTVAAVSPVAPVAPVSPIAAVAACPPQNGEEDEDAAVQSNAFGTSRAQRVRGSSVARTGVTGATAPMALGQTFSVLAGGGDAKEADRVARLEARVERLSAQVERLTALLERQSHAGAGGTPSPFMPAPAIPGKGPRAIPAIPMPPGAPSGHWNTPGWVQPSQRDDGKIIVRSYKLPKGKLEALTALMVRSDVPIRVRSSGDSIEVHATESQHDIFRAFLQIIDPRTGASAGGGESAGGSGTANAAAIDRWRDVQTLEQQQKEKASAEKMRARSLDLRTRMRSMQQRVRRDAEQREREMNALQSRMESLRQHAEQLQGQAESIREQAEEVGDGDEAKDKSREKSLNENAASVEQKAREIEQEVRELERKAREMEKLAEGLSDKADAIGEVDDALGEVPPQTLAAALRSAADALRGDALAAAAKALREIADSLEKGVPAGIEESLKKFDKSVDQPAPKTIAKAMAKLADTLREKAERAAAEAEEAAAEAEEQAARDEAAGADASSGGGTGR